MLTNANEKASSKEVIMNVRPHREAIARTRRLTLSIHGLGCGGGGVLTAERALTRTPGVIVAYVNPATEMAYVEYDPALTGPDRLIAAVESAGLGAGDPVIR